ncbi:MAG: hypothetical protein RLZZ210_99 [Pseudomonadota bacterium]|jgi:hypothetical protein
MIKGLFFGLVGINLGLGIFMATKSTAEPTSKEVQKIVTQINPSAVKIISDNKDSDFDATNTNDVAFAPTNDVSTCVEVNLANESEVTFMQKELQNIMNNVQTKIISTTQTGSYLVYAVPSSKNFKAQVADLRRSKISPISTGQVKGKTVVALGMFADKPRALEYLDSLRSKGVKKTDIENVSEGSMNVFWLRLPYASLTEEGLLRKISSKYGIVTRFCQ